MQALFITISSLLAIISPITYVIAIRTGAAKPHRTTRFVLLVITILSFASLFAQHNSVAIWLAAISAIQSIVIFILSINHGMGGWEKSDIVCLGVAMIGIILWKITDNPFIALTSSLLADFTGMIPALIKTYVHPETEVWYFYALDSVASICTLLAIAVWTPQEYLYPIYIFSINLCMVLLSLRKKIL